jgi:hypothetical protein
MARRPGGKAASRKARQRRPQRPAAPMPPSTARVDVPMPEPRASAVDAHAAPTPRRISAPSAERALAGTGSSLSAHDRAEYHYVERDLRNIAILTAVMFVLLAAAWAAFTALGIVG